MERILARRGGGNANQVKQDADGDNDQQKKKTREKVKPGQKTGAQKGEDDGSEKRQYADAPKATQFCCPPSV
ncbi:MAG: hypothetical protein FWJ83_08460 [Limnochordales bacterium]